MRLLAELDDAMDGDHFWETWNRPVALPVIERYEALMARLLRALPDGLEEARAVAGLVGVCTILAESCDAKRDLAGVWWTDDWQYRLQLTKTQEQTLNTLFPSGTHRVGVKG